MQEIEEALQFKITLFDMKILLSNIRLDVIEIKMSALDELQ